MRISGSIGSLVVALAGSLGLAAASGPAAPAGPSVRLERITTAVPWPRGIVVVDDQLIALARGRHRRAGGPDPTVGDMAGTLFRVRLDVSEPVVPGESAGEAVTRNAEVLVLPTVPPFRAWDRSLVPASRDREMDRPYCTLAWDPASRNYFICGFSGADSPDGTFRKNPTDSVLRFDTRSERWSVVDVHRGDVVPDGDLGPWIPSDSYPHHDPARNAAPHGWLNGPDGAEVVGRWLYVVAKDNNLLVRYDLGAIRDDPQAGPPDGVPVFGDAVDVSTPDGLRRIDVWGHSAVAAHDGFLYVGFRTTSQIVRFPLAADDTLQRPLVGELVARFDPYDADTGRSHDLMDIAFNSRGELFVSTAAAGRIWKLGVPGSGRVFDGRAGTSEAPYADIRALTGKPGARTGNIAFDAQDRLYVCSGNYDAGNDIAGVVYRVVEDPRF